MYVMLCYVKQPLRTLTCWTTAIQVVLKAVFVPYLQKVVLTSQKNYGGKLK